MYIKNISKKYKEKIYTNEPIRELTLTAYNNSSSTSQVIDNSLIRRISKEHQIIGGETLSLGSCTSALITLECDYEILDYIEDNCEIQIKERVKYDSTFYDFPLGIFFVSFDNIDKTNANYVTIRAYDKLYFLNKYYSTSSEFIGNKDKTRREVVEDICSKNGMYLATPNFVNNEIIVESYNDELTYKSYLTMISERAGGFCVVGRKKQNGLIPLHIKSLNELDEVEVPSYMLGENTLGDTKTITRVVLNAMEHMGDETGTTIYMSDENILNFGENEVTNIYNAINGFTYQNATIKTWGDSNIDDGDIININGIKTFAQPTMEYANGWYGTYETSLKEVENQDDNTTISSGTFKKLINQKIEAKVGVGDVIASLNVEVKDNVGVVELTGNSVTIESDNFKLDTNGNMECNNAKLNGGELILEDGGEEDASISILDTKGLDSRLTINEDISNKTLGIKTPKNYTITNLIEETTILIKTSNNTTIEFLPTGEELTYQIIKNPNYETMATMKFNKRDDFEYDFYELSEFMIYDDIYLENVGTITELSSSPITNLLVLRNNNKLAKITKYSASGFESDIYNTYNPLGKLYTEYDIETAQKIMTQGTPTKEELDMYDINQNGRIDASDILVMVKSLSTKCSMENPAHLSINTTTTSDYNGTNEIIKLTDGYGKDVFQLGLNGLIVNGCAFSSSKILWDGSNTPLWPSSSHTIELKESVHEQMRGIILMYAPFQNGSVLDGYTCCRFVPKEAIDETGNNGTSIYDVMAWVNFSKIASKLVFVYNDKIIGYNSNNLTGSANGITYDNSSCVLTYVLGV